MNSTGGMNRYDKRKASIRAKARAAARENNANNPYHREDDRLSWDIAFRNERDEMRAQAQWTSEALYALAEEKMQQLKPQLTRMQWLDLHVIIRTALLDVAYAVENRRQS